MKKRKSGTGGGGAVKKAGVEVGDEGPAAKQVVAPVAPAAVVEERREVEYTCTVGDEQMWWGGQWFPSWGVEGRGEAYISALYSDVWDGYDDIWGFRNSAQLPTPPPNS